MSTFKRAKVVMLPTNEKTKHLMVYSDVEKTKGKLILNGLKNDEYKEYQHLYIISDDEIKLFAWVYNNKENIVEQITSKTQLIFVLEENKENQTYNKIIATTDKTLSQTSRTEIPQPSKQFIEKYIEEYNKSNIITDVLVEYESDFNSCFCTKDICNGNNCPKKLNINPKDNTITIKKVKEVYTKEELCQVLEKYTSFIWSEVGIHYPISLGIDAKDKFINNEL